MLSTIEPTEDTATMRLTRAEVSGEPIACMELDRFCEHCAYNLRTLPVFCDERTGIPIVRCTECGKFQSANDTATIYRPWLHRLTSLVLGGWVIVMIAIFFWLCVAETAITCVTLEELTIRSGTQIQRFGSTTIQTVRGSGPLEVWTDMPDHDKFIAAILTGSTSVAFVFGLLMVVVMAHWRKLAYYAVALSVPLLVACIAVIIWREEAPHLLGWSLTYIAAHAGANILGASLGVTFGRPIARLAVRIFIPPTLRPRLAYLWIADGKTLPVRS
jgi:hypothetical protein